MVYNGFSARQPPVDRWRVRVFTYGCAIFAAEEDGKKTRAVAQAASGGAVRRQFGG